MLLKTSLPSCFQRQVIPIMVVTKVSKYIWVKTEARLDICHTTRGSHAERH